jgi:uncharacterized protein (DUF362 family)
MLSQSFGPTTLARLSDPHDLKQLLTDPWLKSDTIIIKPNLVFSVPGYSTDVRTLRVLLEALDSQIIVTESHILGRTLKWENPENLGSLKPIEGINFKVKGKIVNWDWLFDGEGWRWQLRHPSWRWFREGGHWEQIRKEEKAFLDARGFSDLFKEFNVEYINVTDEVWSGRNADPDEVKKIVESKYGELFTEKLYSIVPKKLFDLRGSTFISLAKLQVYPSFTIKNLFGMIPDPYRAWWHGTKKNPKIGKSIIDINKVYRSLFNVYGICEALYSTMILHPEGEYPGQWGRYNVVDDVGLVALGRDPVSLDAIFCNLTGFDKNRFGEYLSNAEKVLGESNKFDLEKSKTVFGKYLPY